MLTKLGSLTTRPMFVHRVLGIQDNGSEVHLVFGA